MDYLGIEVDEEKNDNAERGIVQKISTDSSKTDVFVIPTNEELVIAIDTAKIAQAADQSPWV
jgi:acetate kinase